MTIKCTTIGVEPNKMCYEICVLAHKCGALKAWEKEKQKFQNCKRNREKGGNPEMTKKGSRQDNATKTGRS